MPCPKAASMLSCEPKCRCKSGNCANIAYLCDDPCEAGQVFDAVNCECTGVCSSSWRITYTSATNTDFGGCSATCSFDPVFNNLLTFSAPEPGTFSTTSFGARNGACGGPSLAGQTYQSVYGIDFLWNAGEWVSASGAAIGSVTDSIAFKITICEGANEGVVYGRVFNVGGGSNGCNLEGQIFTVTSAEPV